MACWNLQILVSLPLVFSVQTCFSTDPTSACRPFCVGNNCLVINRDKVDFSTAEERCRARKGQLMTFQSPGDDRLHEMIRKELNGNFWIGLFLPANTCSSFSAKMRGYEWTSGRRRSDHIPSFITWKNDIRVCSPYCVSLSDDRTFTEKPCTEKTDGFLCRTYHKNACVVEKSSFFRSSKGCSDAPCEQNCTVVKDGFKCSCFRGYAPHSEDPRRCRIHCSRERCPAICEKNTNSACFCAEGFIINDQFCEDIDECIMGECDQECKNTFGSFICSCKEGYVLTEQVKCVRAVGGHFDITTPSAKGYVKPNNDTMKGSSVSAATFIWLWILLALFVVGLICIGRVYVMKRHKRREQNSNPIPSAAVGNT
uniref:thrombomodulin n=1 Tax=Doryrhamphus excisus TaxID=161450 RepID=UPI0025ADB5DB|nr:thrombomodulin [Doryrhamphus excisus]